jgi:hypothetical protein
VPAFSCTDGRILRNDSVRIAGATAEIQTENRSQGRYRCANPLRPNLQLRLTRTLDCNRRWAQHQTGRTLEAISASHTLYIYCGMSAESQHRQPLLGNGSVKTPVATQWLSNRHVIASTDKHATIEELLEEVCSMLSVQRLTMTSCHYRTVLRRKLEEYDVGVTRPPACEDMSPGAVGSRYQAAQ